MALVKRILEVADLPPEDFSREVLCLDVKGKHLERYSAQDLAEQVAAFANTLGGCILVGANEQDGGTYRYDPMAESQADAIRIRYEQATQNFCSPQPLLEPSVIAYAHGYVVAVNVWPFAGQAVGVRNGPKDKSAWLIPYRVGTQTRFLEMEQLAMFMLPQIRQAAVRLSQIPRETMVRILDQNQGNTSMMLRFDGVQPESSTFTMKGQGAGKGVGQIQELEILALPLEAVHLVWKNYSGLWQIALHGQLCSDGSYLPVTRIRPV